MRRSEGDNTWNQSGSWHRRRLRPGRKPGPGLTYRCLLAFGYLGAEAAVVGGGCGGKLQQALTVVVGAYGGREKQLGAEALALHVHCTRPQPGACVLSRHQRPEVFGGMGHSVAVPSGEYAPRVHPPPAPRRPLLALAPQ
jgi:hypothetical protein